MSKLVVISLLGGDLNQGFPVVIAQIWNNNQFYKINGSLPDAPELSKLYKKWQLLYKAVYQGIGSHQRIKIYQEDVNNVSTNDFADVCQKIQSSLNAWLKYESFQNIERQLRTLLSQDDEIRLVIETNTFLLHGFPWHLWNFFEHYPKAELALSNHEYASVKVQDKCSTGKAKILAILGNSSNINIEQDQHILEQLTDAQTTFLIQPTRADFDEQLWNKSWDILFFAGHSGSDIDRDIGKFYINQTESLTIIQLQEALREAIKRGLKMAIFNSCDGISLARNLATLNIPQIIVMREMVPDLVAQKFLQNFLLAFAGGKSFYLAVREARSKLKGLENNFPCASWLPVIYQNPTNVPSTWKELCGANAKATAKNNRTAKLWKILASTLIVATSVTGLRYLGVLERSELQAFDQILNLLPSMETTNSRVLLVKVTDEYIINSGKNAESNIRGVKSVSDSILAKILHKLQKYKASVIGIDIYREIPDFPNESNPIKLDDELNKPNVVAICKGKDTTINSSGIKPPASIDIGQVGFTDAVQDIDNIVRRHIMMMNQEPASPCKTEYSFALQLAIRYLFTNHKITKINPQSDYIQLGDRVFKGLKPGSSGVYQQQNNLNGIQIPINYYRNEVESVTIEDVLNNEVDPDDFQGRIVVIGVTARENNLGDTWLTPYSAAQSNNHQVYGVTIQAQKVNQILDAVLNNRPILWFLPSWGDFLVICAFSLASGLIIWRSPQRYRAVVIFANVVVLYGICAFCIYIQGLWLPFVPSTYALVASGLVVLFTWK
ncbi:MAG: CHASE2 domain-containing protein [Scytonematopsis contorta HA4267-MV1]|jgi:CHASE2 domain-containing sensor protein|nr:CHASE2 domain-containing protein [Scytonematopsis contorta HA4267-MV1]